MKSSTETDFLIIGGGFYGSCLALLLRSLSEKVTIVEAEGQLMTRASRANQARIHTGFHYPRSALTAAKSMRLHQVFASDFPDAVVSDFQMLYAISKRNSKVSSKRFLRMFSSLHAPIKPARPSQEALFDLDMIEAVFQCTEWAFDYSILREYLTDRLERHKIDIRLSTSVETLSEDGQRATVTLSDGAIIHARHVFNVTYSQINHVLKSGGYPMAATKHELAEIALVEPPDELDGIGITVMDGPFFSVMPFPAEKSYSLTHVRYTPHCSWTDKDSSPDPYSIIKAHKTVSKFKHMVHDAQRYVPALSETKHIKSLFEVKTILSINEENDGRPILYQRKPSNSRVVSVMGGKIDNIYDLFEMIRIERTEFSSVNDSFLFGSA